MLITWAPQFLYLLSVINLTIRKISYLASGPAVFTFPLTIWSWKRTLTYFRRGSITVQLTSCLTGLDLTKPVNLLLIQLWKSS